MKKMMFIVGLTLLLLTGCGAENEKTMTCSRSMEQNGMKADLEYVVNYKDDIVSTVKSVEKIESDSMDLEEYKTIIEATYAPYLELDYYDANVTIEGNVLTSTVDIDYSKINVDEMIKIDSANAMIFEDGKVHIDNIKAIYESVGATCDK